MRNLKMYIVHLIYLLKMINFRSLRLAGHVARMEEDRRAFKILASKPTGKIPLGRLKRTWEDNIRIDLKEIGINTRNWVDSAYGLLEALVNATLNHRVA